MQPKNSVFIATSLDGYIADREGKIDWLESIPNPSQDDIGYVEFNSRIDALIMGRISFETVLGFDVSWPYDKPVYVLSNSMTAIPKSHEGKAFLVNGSLEKVLAHVHQQGHHRLYIDGGTTIQNFLKQDLIDEIIITNFPILLGGGYPLFGSLPNRLEFELVKSNLYLGQIVQRHYRRKN